MKPFLLWLSLSLTAFGGLAGGYHFSLSQEPRRLFVVIDSSFEMNDAWYRMPAILGNLSERRYTVFALATEKGPIHDWQGTLHLGRAKPYAPRDLSRLESGDDFQALSGADEIVFVTNAPEGALGAFDDWTVLRP
jgi:hypothetical protein